MSRFLRNIRRFRSSEKKENEDEERSTIMALIWKGLKDGFSSTIGKWVSIAMTFIVVTIGGWIINNTYINPLQVREIRGYVYEMDSDGKPLTGATVFVVGQKEVQFEADENGYFSGEARVRKNTGQIVLSCNMEGYAFFQKPVDVPVDKKEPIITNFHLKPL
ncbi:MAG: hypothetical protein J5I94_27055 [Phaeodactylibacter sp.]|nr:hypothetical protein [Phaeodactylibacter sp.]